MCVSNLCPLRDPITALLIKRCKPRFHFRCRDLVAQHLRWGTVDHWWPWDEPRWDWWQWRDQSLLPCGCRARVCWWLKDVATRVQAWRGQSSRQSVTNL